MFQQDKIIKMSTNDNITVEISTTDVDLTSEMDVQSTQTSQIDQPNTLASVETEKVNTSISTRSESKPDETSAMMQLLLKLDKKLDEMCIRDRTTLLYRHSK